MSNSRSVCIVAAKRTPIGSFGGSLKNFSATQLGSLAIQSILNNSSIDPSLIQEVIMGSVLQANLGQAPARQAAKFAGLLDSAICTTINKVCSSGMKAVSSAAQSILLGDSDVIVAGGMESMSNVPFYSSSVRWGNKYGNTALIDGLVKDGLTDVYNQYPMGNAAELCASTMNISRNQQDDFAIESYKRSKLASENGRFDEEIIPVNIPTKKGDTLVFSRDEEPNSVDFEKIPFLKPVFDKEGTVTAANASTLNDGAAALLLMTQEKAKELGLKPLAIIHSYADAEQAPEWFTTTPFFAIKKALKKSGFELKEVDYFEINEAFSVVALANLQLLNLDASKVNVNGGAVALGHPLGCSGARILVTLINVLKQKNGKIGVASICNGGGGASAIVIENCTN